MLSIAVLHHISTEARRKLLIAETMRIVKRGGEALFYAWALEQEAGGVSGHRFEGQDVLVPFHFRTNNLALVVYNPDRWSAARHGVADPVKKAVVYQRYCHVYREGELPGLFRGLAGVEVIESYYDAGNWCVRARRTL